MNTTPRNEELREEFYKECVFSHPGDSGVGGNDPQEPVCFVDAEPEDVWKFISSHLTAERTALIEEMKSKKVIMWSDDSAQHIRNIQHNETIEQMIELVSHLESDNKNEK